MGKACQEPQLPEMTADEMTFNDCLLLPLSVLLCIAKLSKKPQGSTEPRRSGDRASCWGQWGAPQRAVSLLQGQLGAGWESARLRERHQHRTILRKVSNITQSTCPRERVTVPGAPGDGHTPACPRGQCLPAHKTLGLYCFFSCRNAVYLVHTELWREVL